jgi:hypothetical protein
LESGKQLYEILYQPYYKLLVQLQSMAGRPTFKCRKIVIEPAVDVFLGYVKSYKSCKHENDEQHFGGLVVLARGEKRISRSPDKRRRGQGVAENAKRTKSKLIFVLCVRNSNLLKGIF